MRLDHRPQRAICGRQKCPISPFQAGTGDSSGKDAILLAPCPAFDIFSADAGFEIQRAGLFCGAGGLSLGFIRAGFSPVGAADFSKAAVETYRTNLGSHVSELDLSNETNLPDATVVVGGPPCQGFSSAGMRRSGDIRNNLVSRFAYIVATLRPKAFVFENVEGFLTAEGGSHIKGLLSPKMPGLLPSQPR